MLVNRYLITSNTKKNLVLFLKKNKSFVYEANEFGKRCCLMITTLAIEDLKTKGAEFGIKFIKSEVDESCINTANVLEKIKKEGVSSLSVSERMVLYSLSESC